MRSALLPLLAWVAINFTVGFAIYWTTLGAGQFSQVAEVWKQTAEGVSRCLPEPKCRSILFGGRS